MGIQDLSEDVVLVTLPPQPQQSDELEAVNTMLAEAIDRDIVIDFSKVEMLTSESICGLLILAKLLAGAGHQLALCSVPPAINDVFVRTGLLSVFEVVDTESDALTHLKNRTMSWSEA